MSLDIVVVGGGIAGASAAYALAARAQVVLLERESAMGYHSTGRSAASFTEINTDSVVGALTAASRIFLEAPPLGFSEVPLLCPRGLLLIARKDQAGTLQRLSACAQRSNTAIETLDVDGALARAPMLQPSYIASALYEPGAMDLDVDALLQGYLRGLRQRGGTVHNTAEVLSASRQGGRWLLQVQGLGELRADVLVNAAGAWADELAQRAGVQPLGLVPMRRTAFTFSAPDGCDVHRWPMVKDSDEHFYFKPDAGRLLASPADATPVAPCDVRPTELDVALGVERVERATTLRVARIVRRWAGLRTFVADGRPVAGFAGDAPGFFWLAAQGGIGIETSPAMASLTAALIDGHAIPESLVAHGVDAATLSATRVGFGAESHKSSSTASQNQAACDDDV